MEKNETVDFIFRKKVVENLLDMSKKSIIESELKEKFIWSKHLEAVEDGNTADADNLKMKFAAQKRERQDTYEPWKEMLEKELSA
jgi:hypothetical protein